MHITASHFDTGAPDEASTHADLVLISKSGLRLAKLIVTVENIDKAVAHFMEMDSVWSIQIYIAKKRKVRSMPCMNDPDAHSLWRDQMITYLRREVTRRWSCVESVALEEGCPYVLQSEDVFEKFIKDVRRHEEARQNMDDEDLH